MGGDENTIFVADAVEDLLVARRLHPVVADVGCVVAGCRELRAAGGEGVVEEEPQPEAVSGSSRSRTASAA